MAAANGEAGPSRHSYDFDRLIETIAEPSSSSALPADQLASSLRIDRLRLGQEALDDLEDELLAPPRDLSGPGLWQYQM